MGSRLASSTLRIGDAAPDLRLTTLEGEELRLADALAGGPVALVFLPGLWSPNARRQLTELDLLAEAFTEDCVVLVAVITEDLQRIARRLGTNAPKFPVLSDGRREIAKDYGVYRAVSRDGIGVTRPSVFLIDQSGMLRFVYVGDADRDVVESRTLHQLSRALLTGGNLDANALVESETFDVETSSVEQPELDFDMQSTSVVPKLDAAESAPMPDIEDEDLLSADSDDGGPDVAASSLPPALATINEDTDLHGSARAVDGASAAAPEDRVVR